jgi:hypothetical protein
MLGNGQRVEIFFSGLSRRSLAILVNLPLTILNCKRNLIHDKISFFFLLLSRLLYIAHTPTHHIVHVHACVWTVMCRDTVLHQRVKGATPKSTAVSFHTRRCRRPCRHSKNS